MADSTIQSLLRALPSVDELLRPPAGEPPAGAAPRWAQVAAAREVLEEARRAILSGCPPSSEALAAPALLAAAQARAARLVRPSLTRVVNATGVVLHTNLGRAPLAPCALALARETAGGYTNLEYDLPSGARGSRQAHVEALLCQLTGAEASLAVNNNAAAVLLAINTLAEGREVVVSRGQLVEIGDSFRIPEIMRKGGALLREVGTTNRTTRADYAAAIGPQTALLLKVHPSNFRVLGFTAEVSTTELAHLGRERGVPVFEDVGSGALLDFGALGLRGEPVVADSVRAGADLVSFSGDKLLGGPQAGLLVGRRDLLQAIRRNPLARAVRIDKLCLAALEATLRLYRDPEVARQEVPILRMLAEPAEAVAARARRILDRVAPAAGRSLKLTQEPGTSEVGGGALPLEAIPTALLAVERSGLSATAVEARLRAHEPPILVRIKDDRVLIDCRTVQDDEAEAVAAALLALAAAPGENR
ncbi:MAG TPA: L-seryl-tRNA(Sec) selenium transferase [Candidatus Sulfotelmatobacter sp.]|nr:L-seryl-tRNA(Sec) selenium transferase [Candidatus Sulfotelmatobacter sp.]